MYKPTQSEYLMGSTFDFQSIHGWISFIIKLYMNEVHCGYRSAVFKEGIYNFEKYLRAEKLS